MNLLFNCLFEDGFISGRRCLAPRPGLSHSPVSLYPIYIGASTISTKISTMSNFSFAEFKQQLDEDKEKYLKEYQSNLSDFLFKIASMPIQFGVYIYLTIRFGEELVPILGTMILIISWSCFTVFSVNRIVENVKYLKNKFESDFSMMLEQSGIEKAVVETDRNQIVSRLNKAIYLIKSYMGIVVIFSICIIVFCGYFIFLYLSNPCL